MFIGRNLLVASKHEKEKVIAPLLQKALGVLPFVLHNLDTDIFGTFTGEIERVDDPFTTIRRKAEWGLSQTNDDLVVASEGSFGPHPSLFFVPADDEILLFIDKKNNIEVIAREVSTETNFGHAEVKSEKELIDFAQKSLFPSHGLILSGDKIRDNFFVKGILDEDTLFTAFHYLLKRFQKVTVQTDMRAMYNPSRMRVIEKACSKLIQNIESCCPVCSCPGFSIREVLPGLPCSLCGSSTNSTLAHLYVCQKCNHKKKQLYPNGKEKEEPTFCDYCNP